MSQNIKHVRVDIPFTEDEADWFLEDLERNGRKRGPYVRILILARRDADLNEQPTGDNL